MPFNKHPVKTSFFRDDPLNILYYKRIIRKRTAALSKQNKPYNFCRVSTRNYGRLTFIFPLEIGSAIPCGSSRCQKRKYKRHSSLLCFSIFQISATEFVLVDLSSTYTRPRTVLVIWYLTLNMTLFNLQIEILFYTSLESVFKIRHLSSDFNVLQIWRQSWRNSHVRRI